MGGGLGLVSIQGLCGWVGIRNSMGGCGRVASVWFRSGQLLEFGSRNEACRCQCWPLDYADAAVLRVLALMTAGELADKIRELPLLWLKRGLMVRGPGPPPLPVAGAVRHVRRSDDGRHRPKQRDDWRHRKNHRIRRPLDTESASSQLSDRIVVSAPVRSKGLSSPRYIFLFLRGNRGQTNAFPPP